MSLSTSSLIRQNENTYIQGERARAVVILVAINADKRVSALVQRTLETDNDKLERL